MATTPTADNTAHVDAAALRAEGLALAGQIADLCAIGGVPHMTAGFIAARKSVDDVRAELLAIRAKSPAGELFTGTMPGQSAEAASKPAATVETKPWREIFAAQGIQTKGAR